MQFSKEQIEKASAAVSAEELLAMAKADSIELTEAEAAEYFDFLNGKRNEDGLQELSAVDLEIVAGGKGEPAAAKYHVGQRVRCGNYGPYGEIVAVIYNEKAGAWTYSIRWFHDGSITVGHNLEEPDYLVVVTG